MEIIHRDDIPPNVRMAREVILIEVKYLEGTGVLEDPYRECVSYWTKDGKRVALVDPGIGEKK